MGLGVPDKVQCPLNRLLFQLFSLALEILCVAAHKGSHHTHAVRADAAACFYNLLFSLGTILALWRNQVKIQVTAALVDVWIAGVILLCALIVRLNIGTSALCNSASEGWQWLTHSAQFRFCHTEVITQRVGNDDLFIAGCSPAAILRNI